LRACRPAISIEQRTAGSNPRSTVATTTEIHDYLRLLYANLGKAHCPKCGKPIERQSAEQIVEQLMKLPRQTKLVLLAPKVDGRKGEHDEELEALRKAGFVRARVDGTIVELTAVPKLDKKKKHTLEVVMDRLVINEKIRTRLTDSVETALAPGRRRVDGADPERRGAGGGKTVFREKRLRGRAGSVSTP
jgi:excinuclease ABC subunit A